MEFFQDRLSDRFPEHQLFANNQEDSGYSHEDKRYLWVFDPLDGVANFQGGHSLMGDVAGAIGELMAHFRCILYACNRGPVPCPRR